MHVEASRAILRDLGLVERRCWHGTKAYSWTFIIKNDSDDCAWNNSPKAITSIV